MAEQSLPLSMTPARSHPEKLRLERTDSLFSNFPNSARDRLVRGVGWSTVGGVVTQGGSFVGSVILARILGKYAFGQLAMILTTVIASSCLAGLGLGITATKYVSEYRITQPQRLGGLLALSSLTALLAAVGFSIGLVWIAPSLALGLGEPSVMTFNLRLSATYVFFTTLNGYQAGALAGFESFRSIARIGVVCGIATLILSWTLTLWLGLKGAILAQCASAFLLWLLYQIALNSECRARNIIVQYRRAWQHRSVLVRFSAPAAIGGMIAPLAMWWCNAALVRNSGYAELAVFSAVSNMRSMVLFLPALIARVTAPFLNNMLAGGDLAGYRRAFQSAVAVNGGLALMLAVVLALTGQRVLRLFGKDFRGSDSLVLILLGAVVVEVVANNLYQALFASGQLWRNLGIISVWTAVLVSFASFATPRYGATGLALSYLVAWCVSAVLYGVVARSHMTQT